MLEIRTQGSRIGGANESTVLWRHPLIEPQGLKRQMDLLQIYYY